MRHDLGRDESEVVEVVHVEPVKGDYQGDSYEGIRHVGTLSFIR